MAWLQSHQTLARHPKTLRVAKLLGISIPTVIGHLHLLWWWCLDYAETGDLAGLESEEIARTALWDGNPQAFVDALINAGGSAKAGFLEHSANGHLVVHDWDEYAGLLIDRRKTNAQRKRDARALSAGHPRDIRRTSAGHPQDIRNLSGARVEKSTVEKSTVPPPAVPPQDSAIASSPQHGKGVRKKVTPKGLGIDFEERMVTKFPALSPELIHDQIELAISHVNAKKYDNTELYVQNWLRREAQNAKSNRNRSTGTSRGSPSAQWPSAAHIPRSEHARDLTGETGAPLPPELRRLAPMP